MRQLLVFFLTFPVLAFAGEDLTATAPVAEQIKLERPKELYLIVSGGWASENSLTVSAGVGRKLSESFAGELIAGVFGEFEQTKDYQYCTQLLVKGGYKPKFKEYCSTYTAEERERVDGIVLQAKGDYKKVFGTVGAFTDFEKLRPTAGIGIQHKKLRLEFRRIFNLSVLGRKEDVDSVVVGVQF